LAPSTRAVFTRAWVAVGLATKIKMAMRKIFRLTRMLAKVKSSRA
jgi:hypothetical protein